MRIKIFSFFIFISLIFIITPVYASKGKQAQSSPLNASMVFSDLMQALSFRPNLTAPEVEDSLEHINRHSGQVMFAKLTQTHPPKQIRLFASKLQMSIDSFKENYPNAAFNSEQRAAITNEFYLAVLDAAELANISSDQFILAFFKAGASLEKSLEDESALSLADRQLINLLLTSSSYQLQFRSYFRNLFHAFDVIEPVAFSQWPNALKNLQLMQSNVQTVSLQFIEDVLGNPLVLADAVALQQQLYNLAAQSDLLAFSTSLALLNLADVPTFLPALAEQMREIGGKMTEMSAEALISSGIFTGPFSGSFTVIGIPEAAIYNWIYPDLKAQYKPFKSLPNKLIKVDGEVRVAPDFGLFEDPYLAFFQLKYDSSLINDLLMYKWHQLGDEVLSVEMRLANMGERYKLRHQESKLKAKLFKKLKGVSTAEKNAIRSLLTVPYFF